MDGSGFLDLRVGDLARGLIGAEPILVEGSPRWYALRVRPQREAAAEAWLARRGVYAFHPVLHRQSVRHGKLRRYQERYLPGYVFARFGGEPIIHRVVTGLIITGAVTRSNGEWGILDPADLRTIHRMRAIDEAANARRREDEARKRRLTRGDKALFQRGVFAGFPCEVVELRGADRVRVSISIYGRETLAEAPVADLVKAEGLTHAPLCA